LTGPGEKADKTPSLLDPESRGGDIAGAGFAFQESVMLSFVPTWLTHEGFEEMIWEAMGDFEAKFFVPGRPHVREFVEVKDHRVPPSEFWKEVRRFRDLDEGSPGTYRRFVLIGKELGEDVKRLRDGLKRVRGPRSFYKDTPIEQASFAGYATMVAGMGHSEDDARFLFERVEIRDGLTTDQVHWQREFTGELTSHFSEYGDLSDRTLRGIYEGLLNLTKLHRNRTLGRAEIEQRIRERIPEPVRPPVRPVVLLMAIEDEGDKAEGQTVHPLRFDWKNFFGGDGRSYPPPEDWDGSVLGELGQAKGFILRRRATRRIRLTGSRRISASLAIGAVFSAVAGFSVEVENRGELWTTDAHPTADTPAFPLEVGGDVFPGERLVVSVGVTREIADEVDRSLRGLGLAGAPTLHLHHEGPVVSAEHANRAAKAIKDAVADALARSGDNHVDLFLAGPSALAVFLGHRLNATARVQCHEWVSRDKYVPTCGLPM
jgi:hypothetical protein